MEILNIMFYIALILVGILAIYLAIRLILFTIRMIYVATRVVLFASTWPLRKWFFGVMTKGRVWDDTRPIRYHMPGKYSWDESPRAVETRRLENEFMHDCVPTLLWKTMDELIDEYGEEKTVKILELYAVEKDKFVKKCLKTWDKMEDRKQARRNARPITAWAIVLFLWKIARNTSRYQPPKYL